MDTISIPRQSFAARILQYLPPFLLFLTIALSFLGVTGIAVLSTVVSLVFYLYGIGNARRRPVSFIRLLFSLFLPGLIFLLWNRLNLPTMFIVPAGALLAVGIGLVIGAQWTPGDRVIGPLLAFVGAVFLIFSSVFTMPRAIESQFTEEVHLAYPDFELLTPDGAALRSDALRGRVVVMEFWASWCIPCQRAFPELVKLYRYYENDPRVSLVAVNSGWRGESMEKAFSFSREQSLPFPVAYDTGGRLSVLFGIRSIPTTVILDKQGILRFRHRGSATGTGLFVRTMEEKIEALLGE